MSPDDWTSGSSASRSSDDTSLSPTTRSRRRCRVPGCPNPACKLISHQQYKPATHTKLGSTPQKNNVVLSDVGQLIRRDSRSSIQRDGVDGLPALPMGVQDPELRLLFHHFFASVFEPLARVFRGPSVASMTEYKNRMLSTALASESYCMGLIVQSQTDIDICRRETVETRRSMEVYTKALLAFRKQIDVIEERPQPAQIELALLSLCTLISYDTFHGRGLPVQIHWSGLQRLVELRGGLHCVTMALAYVVHVDRICAQKLNQRPAFTNPTPPIVCLPKSQWSRYGLALRDEDSPIRTTFMSHVVEHCIETCCLLELWELSNGDTVSEPQEGPCKSEASLEYLYYIRDRVDEQFSMLHADLWKQDIRDKCLLWAARIVEYPVTWSNQIPTLNSHICDHLLQSLRTQDMSKIWKDNTGMLIWILFVLATAQTRFNGRDQVITYLRRIISLKYQDRKWPSHWWKMELENVQEFVWSDSHNTAQFHVVCRELEGGSIKSNSDLTLPIIGVSPSGAPHVRAESDKHSEGIAI